MSVLCFPQAHTLSLHPSLLDPAFLHRWKEWFKTYAACFCCCVETNACNHRLQIGEAFLIQANIQKRQRLQEDDHTSDLQQPEVHFYLFIYLLIFLERNHWKLRVLTPLLLWLLESTSLGSCWARFSLLPLPFTAIYDHWVSNCSHLCGHIFVFLGP